MNSSNLYEIVYSVSAQMFLTQVDTIFTLITQLKKKFPTQNVIMDK
jgi:hypothetical protein